MKRALCVALFFVAAGCDEKEAEPDAPAKQDVESPNARILPAPLDPSSPGKKAPSIGVGGARQGDGRARPPVPLPARESLHREELPRQVATGLSLEGHFVWPDTERTITVDGEKLPAWPTVSVQIASDSAADTARQRIELTSSLFTMPQGTELRSRLDADGWVVVWPDDRSYRVVPRGALRAVLQERRVDRVPALPLNVQAGPPGKTLGATTQSFQLDNALGELEVELALAPEVGAGGQLLCRFILELFRAATDQPWCAHGMAVVRANFTWDNGTRLSFVVDEMSQQPSLNLNSFRMPPSLAIFKPGELPPERYAVWSQSQIREAFPPNEAGEQIVFENELTVPLYLIVDQKPLTRIGPGEKRSLAPPVRDYEYAARDFLGQIRLPGGVVRPPVEVVLGGEEDAKEQERGQ